MYLPLALGSPFKIIVRTDKQIHRTGGNTRKSVPLTALFLRLRSNFRIHAVLRLLFVIPTPTGNPRETAIISPHYRTRARLFQPTASVHYVGALSVKYEEKKQLQSLLLIYHLRAEDLLVLVYTVSRKKCATFIFTITSANVHRFSYFFHC